MLRHLIFISGLLVTPVLAEQSSSGLGSHLLPEVIPAPAGDVITDEELAARQEAEPFGGLAPEEPVDAWSMERMSVFLSIDGYGTVLPRGSVLFVPAGLASAITDSPQDEMLPWLEFLTLHRARITTLEVTMEQVTGRDPFTDEASAKLLKSDRIVVGTLRGSPITVHARPQTSLATNP